MLFIVFQEPCYFKGENEIDHLPLELDEVPISIEMGGLWFIDDVRLSGPIMDGEFPNNLTPWLLNRSK